MDKSLWDIISHRHHDAYNNNNVCVEHVQASLWGRRRPGLAFDLFSSSFGGGGAAAAHPPQAGEQKSEQRITASVLCSRSLPRRSVDR